MSLHRKPATRSTRAESSLSRIGSSSSSNSSKNGSLTKFLKYKLSSDLNVIKENEVLEEGQPPTKKQRHDHNSNSSSDEVVSVSSDKDSVIEVESNIKRKIPFLKQSSNEFTNFPISPILSKPLNNRDMRSNNVGQRRALEEKKNIHPPRNKKKEVEMCPDISVGDIDVLVKPDLGSMKSKYVSTKEEGVRRSKKTKMPSDLREQSDPKQTKISKIFAAVTPNFSMNQHVKDTTASKASSLPAEPTAKNTVIKEKKEEITGREKKPKSILSDSVANEMVKQSQESFKLPSPVKAKSSLGKSSVTSSKSNGSSTSSSIPEVDVLLNNNLNQLIDKFKESADKEKRKAEDTAKPKRTIVRQSTVLNKSDDQLEVSKKRIVGRIEIESTARITFNQIYKDVETLLELHREVQICPDYRAALNVHRQQLSNRYHVNFNFFLARTNQQIGALGSLRRINLHYYPNAEDLHTILFKIIPVIIN